MQILNIAKQQLNANEQGQVIEKFSDYFGEIRDFGPKDRDYPETAGKRVKKLGEDEANKARDLLVEVAEESVNRIQNVTDSEVEPGLILFVGSGVRDGHGILVDGDAWVALDLKTFADRLEVHDQAIYLAHEATHAFHYANSPSFYFGNDGEFLVRPPVFKMMVAEGLATYVSFLATPGTIHDAYWFGRYSREKVEEWIGSCERERDRIADRIDTGESEVPSDLMEELFAVTGRDLGKARTGYYYGTKIVQNVIEENDLGTALNMELSDYKNYIYSYFELG
ncbi:hypothetical protein KGY77_09210 [Candidatus Bipolaricaulota bacterium]|nr:hypothetical protein [Candidatus Bipolaricaulota bacterium]MBS3792807.1 hypothetical protein [Candidatus Bipolaricaulota bacterium]